MTDEQLSDMFKRDLPEQESGQWADDARRRHDRQRRAVPGIAAVAVLAVVTPFALQFLGGGGDTAVPANTESPSVVTAGAGDRDLACAGASESAVGELPGEAVRLWLCDEPGEIGFSRKGPQEPLTQGVDEALAAFHNLDVADAMQGCRMEYLLTYVVVAEGADGTLTPVSGGLHGCRTVGNRSGADAFLAKLGELWGAQRAAEPASSEVLPTEQLCSATGSILPATVDGATQAALCQPNTFSGEQRTGVPLSADLLDRVLASIKESPVAASIGEWEPTADLVLANDWGDTVALTRFASGAYQWEGQIWRPQGGVAAELDALLGQVGRPAAQDPGPTPNCDEPRAAAAGSPATVGDDTQTVSICVENRADEPRWAAPAGGLWEPGFVQRAVAAFNDLPVRTAECVDTRRADVFVTFQDAAGAATSVQMTSCGPETGAVAKDGPDFLATINNLIREQAGSSGMGMHYGAQELCPQLSALVPFDPISEGATQIVACVGTEGELPVDLTPDLVAALAADISATAAPEGWEPGGGTLVWVNKFGEPMTMIRATDGSFLWSQDDVEHRWDPAPSVKAELDRIFGI